MTTSTTVDQSDLVDLVCELAAIAHRLRRLSAPTDDPGRDDAHHEARRDLDAAARLVDSALDRLHAPIQR